MRHLPGPLMPGSIIRRATIDDAAAIAGLWLASFRATYSFRLAHTDDQVRRWIRDVVTARQETWVVTATDEEPVALLSLDGEMLDQLYVKPGWTGQGIGSELVRFAKVRRPDGLALYTFQVNGAARRFYERHGFKAVWFGDGSANAERQPDVRYEWRPSGTAGFEGTARGEVRAVVFDVGETLVDETRSWGVWADWLGVPRLTFFAALGAVVARGGDHREVFELFRPGIDLRQEAERLGVVGRSDLVSLDDLYADAIDCLMRLRADGYRLGLAGNQPAPAASVLATLGIPFDLVATSADWGVAKPEGAFFARIAGELRLPPASIAYVGDRLDNDIRPALAAGMVPVFVRRGPWGWIQAGRRDPPEARIVVETLRELPVTLARLR